MPKQFLYKGRPTAKSTLFTLWDDGFDDTNAVLAGTLGVTVSTVRSYRMEWKKRVGRGVKRIKRIILVREEDVPFETCKGIVWCVPREEKLKCERCPVYEECRAWVGRGGYLGCEEVYECELWRGDE